jgi:hypothetical protein
MKIRAGFVSNSSSSSFVVFLPENFVETIDYEKITDGDEDFPLDKFKEMLNEFIRRGSMSHEEIYEYDDDYEFMDLMDDLIRPYIIASVECGSDRGSIVVASREKIKKLII